MKRGHAYGWDLKRIQEHIFLDIKDFKDLYYTLPENKKGALTFKTHTDFARCSLIGIENYLIISFYLFGRLATEGTQVKVHGKKAFFYEDLNMHFKFMWANAKLYDLNEPEPKQGIILARRIIEKAKGIHSKNSN